MNIHKVINFDHGDPVTVEGGPECLRIYRGKKLFATINKYPGIIERVVKGVFIFSGSPEEVFKSRVSAAISDAVTESKLEENKIIRKHQEHIRESMTEERKIEDLNKFLDALIE